MALVPTDNRFVLVPYLGSSRPESSYIQANGLKYIQIKSNGDIIERFCGVVRPEYDTPVVGTLYKSNNDTCIVFITYSENYEVVEDSGSTVLAMRLYLSNTTYNVYYNYTVHNTYIEELGADAKFNSVLEAIIAFTKLEPPSGYSAVNYRSNNAIVSGPTILAPGASATVYVTTQPGFNLTTNDISVVKNGEQLTCSYTNGVLTFQNPS